MEAGAIAPRIYLLSRDASPGLVQTALAAFSITPLSCVIITDMKDRPLASSFGELVVRTEDEAHSIKFADDSFKQTNMPSLVIGKNKGIVAIYEDGHMEDLPWPDHDSTVN